MHFDLNNKVVKLCVVGMDLEGAGKLDEALSLFQQAWDEAKNDFEKFTAAHYLARQQKSVLDKLKWDQTSLDLALKIKDQKMEEVFPSLYLNIGKCYEDLDDLENAKKNYALALSFTSFLTNDGYSNMIKSGIKNGLDRVKVF